MRVPSKIFQNKLEGMRAILRPRGFPLRARTLNELTTGMGACPVGALSVRAAARGPVNMTDATIDTGVGGCSLFFASAAATITGNHAITRAGWRRRQTSYRDGRGCGRQGQQRRCGCEAEAQQGPGADTMNQTNGQSGVVKPPDCTTHQIAVHHMTAYLHKHAATATGTQ